MESLKLSFKNREIDSNNNNSSLPRALLLLRHLQPSQPSPQTALILSISLRLLRRQANKPAVLPVGVALLLALVQVLEQVRAPHKTLIS